MPQKVTIDGKDVEMFTAEEVAATKKEVEDAATKTKEEAEKSSKELLEKAGTEAVEAYKKENPDQKEALEKAEKDLKDVQASLEAKSGDDDDEQKKRLIKERDEAKETLKTELTELGKQITDLKGQSAKDIKEVELAKFTDAEERKKVEFEFDRYRPEDNARADIIERVAKAAEIAGVQASANPGALDNAGGGAGQRGDLSLAEKGKPSEQSKEIAKALGVKPEELEKKAAEKAEKENKQT